MRIQLDISEHSADFFLQYLDSLKEGIIKNMVISDDSRSFMVGSVAEVRKRLVAAEKNADYKEHDDFWEEMGVS